ncbi:phage holin family protein [Streptomyces spinosus]|uniref:phage holin family protein n=1 Tax=Streptomyces spinosus TaxID=2872623 RepID=UPI001CEDD33C|nr:phage holin family protein [Streptomyces spinosus]
MYPRRDGEEPAGSPVGDAAARLAEDTAELARREVRAIQQEALSALRRLGAGGALLAGAGTCSVLALWAAHEAALRGVESVLPRGRAALTLACLYASSAAALGMAARNRLRSAAQATADSMTREAQRLEQGQTESSPVPTGTDQDADDLE